MMPSLPMFTGPSDAHGSSTYYTGYRVILPVFASVSLATDITIAGIMIWFVRDQSSDQPLPLLTSTTQLTRNEILSKRLKSRITRLVHLIIGTGALTGMLTSSFFKVLSRLSGYYISCSKPRHPYSICPEFSRRLGTRNCSIDALC
jgi:hypothetical protein